MNDTGLAVRVLHDFPGLARSKLSPQTWDYVIGGAETETTLRRNRLAWDALAFRPRVLRDVSRIEIGTTFLEHTLRLPLLLAPIGSLQDLHAELG